MATFTQWVDAYALKERELADFYFKRFRDEFQPAVNAWVATRPLKNPDAPLTPFAMPQYKLAAQAEADRLDAALGGQRRQPSGATSSARPTTSSRSSSSPSRSSSRASARGSSAARLRQVAVAIGCVLFLGTVTWIATFPVNVSL